MPEVAEGASSKKSLWPIIKKRWRGWLRAIHRDFGYVAVGFTVIYALSGLAINHIKDWDPNFTSSEVTMRIAAIPDDVPDAEAVRRVTTASAWPPTACFAPATNCAVVRDGASVTSSAIKSPCRSAPARFFLRVANWLHYNRGKKAWTYVADVCAFMLLCLAISGIFMIKGRLGFKWRGAALISLGVGVPATYVLLSGGPNAHQAEEKVATKPTEAPAPTPDQPAPASDGFERPKALHPPDPK
jgi:hypothetical protein